MKKRYQIDKQRAAQQFRRQAGASTENIQFALPLPEVLALAQKGLMNLALAAFTGLAERMMHWEVSELAGPKNQANAELLWAESRWNRIRGFREMPILVKELELAVVKAIPVNHASVA